jgi:membrane protease YdiL (CAAX protease family)
MENGRQRHTVLWLGIALEGGLAVLAWGLAGLLNIPLEQKLRWDVQDIALGIAASLPLLLLFWLCLRLPAAPLRRIRDIVEKFIRPLFADCSLAELASLSLLAGVGEELLFRGVLQELLCGWWGLGAGLATASLVFGLLHALTPTYAVLATLMGAYLGGVWLATGNLLPAIIAHALYDFLALVVLVRYAPAGG